MGILVPYGEGKKIISNLNDGQIDYYRFKDTIDKSSYYSVNIYQYRFENMLEEGIIYPLDNSDQNIFAVRPEYYDDKTGITSIIKEGGEINAKTNTLQSIW